MPNRSYPVTHFARIPFCKKKRCPKNTTQNKRKKKLHQKSISLSHNSFFNFKYITHGSFFNFSISIVFFFVLYSFCMPYTFLTQITYSKTNSNDLWCEQLMNLNNVLIAKRHTIVLCLKCLNDLFMNIWHVLYR